jgi:uncharacterized delta-60 repeat protein
MQHRRRDKEEQREGVMCEANVRGSAPDTTPHELDSIRGDTQGHPLLVRLVAAPQRERGLVPMAIASGLLCPVAWSAPGDLDPSFGTVGRVNPWPESFGTARALESVDDDEILVAGGEYYFSYYYGQYFVTDFASRLLAAGERDATFAAAQLENTDVYDIAVQSDGKAVGVGSSISSNRRRLTVFRLLPDGSLDAGFGSGGIVNIEDTAGGMSQVGRSVVIEPSDGRIVVAGTRSTQLIVVRLLADGAPDLAFGTAGLYEGNTVPVGLEPRMVRVADGGYRITVHNTGCRVLALDASGRVDQAYGTAGLAQPDSQAPASVQCTAMAAQGDGALVLAGRKNDAGFAARLLDSGATDPSFDGSAIAAVMTDATAVAIGNAGSIMVAGHDKTGLSGAVVVRLQANGHLDTLYGKSGSTLVELDSVSGGYTTIHDMQVLTDGRVIVSGGQGEYLDSPFVARLLGAGGGPGVLSVRTRQVNATEQTGQVTVTVQRTGGSSGAVSVAYNTVDDGFDWSATAGADFTATMGNLSWGDGDSSEREITIPIVADNDDLELEERFGVVLSDPVGGAGLGTRRADAAIRGFGYPAGILSVSGNEQALESSQVAQFFVNRNYYGEGAVSVTVTPVGLTATAGKDFAAAPVTLTWADGDMSTKVVEVPITRNRKKEADETLTVALSAPTGGAILAAEPPVTITIVDNVGNTGGGGRSGALEVLLLGFAGLLRRVRRPG